jgi:hypothetical protein
MQEGDQEASSDHGLHRIGVERHYDEHKNAGE